MKNNNLKLENGFSLVELMVAMVILLIIVTVFTTMFTSSYSGIFRAGHKSEALFKAQAAVDNAIVTRTGAALDGQLIIQFNGADDITYNLGDAKKIITNEIYQGQGGEDLDVTLVYFLPGN